MCGQNNHDKAVLLCAKTLSGDQEFVFKGYDCVSQFCLYVFGDVECVKKCEWLIANFGSGFDFFIHFYSSR